MTKEKLPTRHVLGYSTTALSASIFFDPLPTILVAFYAMNTSLSMAAIGTVMLFSRMFDAITDPLIGILSDKTNTPIGKRKPWLIAGALLGMFAVYFFFNPPGTAGVLYFFFAFNLYYFARTMLLIPFYSWGSEITRDYDERSRLGAYFGLFMLGGQIFYMALPMIVSSPLLPIFESPEFTPGMISLIGWVGIILLPLCVGIAVLLAPTGKHVSTASTSLIQTIRSIRGNGVFWYYITGFGLYQIGFGVFFALVIILLSAYMGLGNKIPLILVVLTVTQIAVMPLWRKAAKRIGKHRVFSIAAILHGLLMPVVFLIEPGPASFFIFLPYAMTIAAAEAPRTMFANAILADIIDYDILKTGSNRAGNYFSVFTMLEKGLIAVAGSIGFWMLAAFSFDAKAAEFTPMAEFGLLFTVGVVPAIFFVAGGVMLWFFPLDARRHEIIRRRIDSLASRSQAQIHD